MSYEVIHDCKNPQEAVERSDHYVGQLGVVTEMSANGNVQGVYSVFTQFRYLDLGLTDLQRIYEALPECPLKEKLNGVFTGNSGEAS